MIDCIDFKNTLKIPLKIMCILLQIFLITGPVLHFYPETASAR